MVAHLKARRGVVCTLFVILVLFSANRIVAKEVPPNIVFAVDASASMRACLSQDIYQDPDTPLSHCFGDNRLEVLKNILNPINLWPATAHLGLAQSDPSANHDGIGSLPGAFYAYPSTRAGILSPLLASKESFESALEVLVLNGDDKISLSEMIQDIAHYLYLGYYHCNDPGLCNRPPIRYACQETHIILFTDGLSAESWEVDNRLYFGETHAIPDVVTGVNAFLDNTAAALNAYDWCYAESGTQRIQLHLMALDDIQPEGASLFSSAAINGQGLFSENRGQLGLETQLSAWMSTLTSGPNPHRAPRLLATGDGLVAATFDMADDAPLGRGHLYYYALNQDFNHPDFGEVEDGGHPKWDGGARLRFRADGGGSPGLSESESTPEPELAIPRRILTDLDGDPIPDTFDTGELGRLCPLLLQAGSVLSAENLAFFKKEDIDGNGVIDGADCTLLIQFIRGEVGSPFHGGRYHRGDWKLGSSIYSTPAFAPAMPEIFTRNRELRRFTQEVIPTNLTLCPEGSERERCRSDIVYMSANDGMVHAFHVGTGRELWAYIPRALLGYAPEKGEDDYRLVDLLTGEKPLFDGPLHISYEWVDGYLGEGKMGGADGQQDASEWLRVLVGGLGGGGMGYFALDISNPEQPYILWEGKGEGAGQSLEGAAISPIPFENQSIVAAIYPSGLGRMGESPSARLHFRALRQESDGVDPFDGGLPIPVDLDHDGLQDGGALVGEPVILDFDGDRIADEILLTHERGVLYKVILDAQHPLDSQICLFFDPEAAWDGPDGGYIQVGTRLPSRYASTVSRMASGDYLVHWASGDGEDLGQNTPGMIVALRLEKGCHPGQLYRPFSDDGVVELAPGERPLGAPQVYAGALYLSTYQRQYGGCTSGEGRVYALHYQSAAPAMDTNDSGQVQADDAPYRSLGAGLPSQVVVAADSLYVATSTVGDDGKSPEILRFDLAQNPHSVGVSIQFRELF